MKNHNPGPKSDTNLPEPLCRKRYDVPDEMLSDRALALVSMAERPHRREGSE